MKNQSRLHSKSRMGEWIEQREIIPQSQLNDANNPRPIVCGQSSPRTKLSSQWKKRETPRQSGESRQWTTPIPSVPIDGPIPIVPIANWYPLRSPRAIEDTFDAMGVKGESCRKRALCDIQRLATRHPWSRRLLDLFKSVSSPLSSRSNPHSLPISPLPLSLKGNIQDWHSLPYSLELNYFGKFL